MTLGSIPAFVDAGVYQRLACGCIMFALEVAPGGPCLCLVENDAPCELMPHRVDDFLPLKFSAARVLELAGA